MNLNTAHITKLEPFLNKNVAKEFVFCKMCAFNHIFYLKMLSFSFLYPLILSKYYRPPLNDIIK